jgi:prepilin-type N-terminal cleavage/methylation domain-containing protein
MTKRLMNSVNGFTLIELLVATILLVSVIAVVFGAFSSAYKLLRTPTTGGVPFDTYTAYNLARESAECFRYTVRQDTWYPSNWPAPTTQPGVEVTDGTFTVDGTGYNRYYTINTVSNDANKYKKARIRVEWGGTSPSSGSSPSSPRPTGGGRLRR